MASVRAVKAGFGTGELLISCVAEHGSAAHPYFASPALTAGPESARNLADAACFLSVLHGRHPGVIELAAGHTSDEAGRAWLLAAAPAMAAERALLTRLAVAAGPVPSTAGGAASEAAVNTQRAALATLASSDRRGCALGAALAFAADWREVRVLIDAAARRFGIAAPEFALGDEDEIRRIADGAGADVAAERALLFGAEQLALQHKGLWSLLEARRLARAEG